ncbi:MAG: outer membrane beta-barrel protein [Sphingomonas sp.]
MTRFAIATAIVLTSCCAMPAAAQTDSSVLVDTAIPDNFDRDRNVGVLERLRPDYEPIGVQLGSFIVKPQVEVGAGYNSNIYLTTNNPTDSGFIYALPSVSATSDWAIDEVALSGSALLRRYLSNGRRNESSYTLRALGRKDIAGAFSLTGEGQFSRLFESPQTGAINSSLSVLSSYNRSFFSLRGQYREGQSRAIIALDRTSFSFNDIEQPSGPINQRDRDRIVWRATGEYQFAISPSLSLYTQGTYSRIDYSIPLFTGVANRSSRGFRIVGGVNFDLAGLMRGKLGAGYVNRNYTSALYHDASGLSVEADVEFFPSALTTIGIGLGRTVEDTSIAATSSFFENRIQLRINHELLQNLLLNGAVEYRRQIYQNSPNRNNFYQATAGATYLSSRAISLNGSLNYLRRTTSGFSSGFNEFRVQVGVTFKR